jgi:hypothetical protein
MVDLPEVELLAEVLALVCPELGGGAGKALAAAVATDDGLTRQSDLLAGLAAWAQRAHESAAATEKLTTRDLADLHAHADRATSPDSGEDVDAAVLHLQVMRLLWVHDVLLAQRGASRHPLADAGLTGIAAVIDLLSAWRDAHREAEGAAGVRVALAPLRHAADLFLRAHRLLSEIAP